MPVLSRPKQTPLSFHLPQNLREHWEGYFEGSSGSTSELEFDAVANLCFLSGAIEGEGFAAGFPTDQDELSFTGSYFDSQLEFETWLHVEDLGRKPFVCIGTVDLVAGTMDGNFTVDCIEPEDCGCGGGGGHFTMRRKRE